MSLTTCIAIGDPHFQVNNVKQVVEFIDKVVNVVIEKKPTFVVVLGDLLHTHERVHTTPLNLATQFIERLSKQCKTFLIVGNHDYCNNQQFLSDSHPFNAFKSIPNVVVCDHVVVEKFNGRSFLFLPYVPPQRFMDALNTVGDKWKTVKCIFAHQEFYGCKLNPVCESTDGDKWDLEYPTVVSGHIHDSHWLQDNIFYTGSSMQHSFSENSEKFIAYLSFYKKIKVEKIILDILKKQIVHINLENIKNFKYLSNFITKLVIKGKNEEIKTFRKGKEFKNLVKHENLFISFHPTEENVIIEKKHEKIDMMIFLKELIDKHSNKKIKESFEELIAI